MQERPKKITVYAINPFTGLTECNFTKVFDNDKDALKYLSKIENMDCIQLRANHYDDDNPFEDREKYIVERLYQFT